MLLTTRSYLTPVSNINLQHWSFRPLRNCETDAWLIFAQALAPLSIAKQTARRRKVCTFNNKKVQERM